MDFSEPIESEKPCRDCGCKYYCKQDNQNHLKFCDYCGLQREYFIKPEVIIPTTITKKQYNFNILNDEEKKIKIILEDLGKENYFNTKTLTEDLIRFLISDDEKRKQIQQQNKVRTEQFSLILDKIFEIIEITSKTP